MKKIKIRIYGFIFVALLVLFDQITKYYSIKMLKDKNPFVIFNDILEFSYLENTGSAFSMFQGLNSILAMVSLLLTIVVVYFYFRIPNTKEYTILRITFLLLTSGAIGNAIDRIVYKHVIDFIYFKLINFPTFNIADSYIVISLCIISVLILFVYKEDSIIFLSSKKE